MTRIEDIRAKCVSIVNYIDDIEQRKQALKDAENICIAGIEAEKNKNISDYAMQMIKADIREREKAVLEMAKDIKPEAKERKKRESYMCEFDCYDCPFDDCITVEQSKKISDYHIKEYKEYMNGFRRD